MLPIAKVVFSGEFFLSLIRRGDPVLEVRAQNNIVNQGLDRALDAMFRGKDPTAGSTGTKYLFGLIGGDDPPTLADTDTPKENDFTEYTGYTGLFRKSWDPVAPSSQSITNSTPREFSLSTQGILQGIFLSDSAVKGVVNGIFWCTALFRKPVPVRSGDVLKVTYTLSAAHP